MRNKSEGVGRVYSKKARRELSKGISNLNGSDVTTGREDQIPVPSSISHRERSLRYDLAFGKITQEEYDVLINSQERK